MATPISDDNGADTLRAHERTRGQGLANLFPTAISRRAEGASSFSPCSREEEEEYWAAQSEEDEIDNEERQRGANTAIPLNLDVHGDGDNRDRSVRLRTATRVPQFSNAEIQSDSAGPGARERASSYQATRRRHSSSRRAFLSSQGGNTSSRALSASRIFRSNPLARSSPTPGREDGLRADRNISHGNGSRPCGGTDSESADGFANRGKSASNVDAAEEGKSVGRNQAEGESDRDSQGRILFYHKPSLANFPTADVPDVVPVFLGCPGRRLALGLPLSEAWQAEDQDTGFNQNLSYTILSWPEQHTKDWMEIRRQQVLFLTGMTFNVVVAVLLYVSDEPDRSRVEPVARPGSFPKPFQKSPSSVDETVGERSEERHLIVALVIGLCGAAAVICLNRAGIALYLVCSVANALLGLAMVPDALHACRYAVDVFLLGVGRLLLSSLTYSWATASAGER